MTKKNRPIKIVDSATVDAEAVLISSEVDAPGTKGWHEMELSRMESYQITIWNKDLNAIDTKLQVLRNFGGTYEWAEFSATGYETVAASTGVRTYSGVLPYLGLRVLAKKDTTKSDDIDAQFIIREAL